MIPVLEGNKPFEVLRRYPISSLLVIYSDFSEIRPFRLDSKPKVLISRPLVYRVPTGRLYMVLLAHFISKMCTPANESIG